MDANTPIEKAKNLGPKSASMLKAIGIETFADLQKVDSINIYLQLKAAGQNVSVNMIYAIEGALRGVHWNKLPKDIIAELHLRLDAATDISEEINS